MSSGIHVVHTTTKHVISRRRMGVKDCEMYKKKNARAKRARILFFIVNYANMWGFCYRCRRDCLISLIRRTRGNGDARTLRDAY